MSLYSPNDQLLNAVSKPVLPDSGLVVTQLVITVLADLKCSVPNMEKLKRINQQQQGYKMEYCRTLRLSPQVYILVAWLHHHLGWQWHCHILGSAQILAHLACWNHHQWLGYLLAASTVTPGNHRLLRMPSIVACATKVSSLLIAFHNVL